MTIPSTHFSLLHALNEEGRREEAWAVFQNRYGNVLLGWCLRRGLSADTAEDLTQDILLKLFLELPRHVHDPARGRFRAWLKAVVNNALTDWWRRQEQRPEPAGIGGTAFQEQLGNLAGPAEELSSLLEEQANTVAVAVLERVRGRVKESTWQAFYQTWMEQRPAEEVAVELGLTVGTVYKATYRVKQLLQEECCRG